MLALPILNPDGIGNGLGFCLVCCFFPHSTYDLRLLTFMLAVPILNPDGIGNGLGFAWSVALSAFDLRLTTSYTSALDLRLTPSHLHAGATNIESRWDWKWLGVCLVCCCFPSSTYDLRLLTFMLALPILNPDGIGNG
ncbi:MAG: hypothetical protein R2828_09060 [Saprospiraceae bacterium]